MSCAPSAHIPHPPVRKAVFPIAGLGTRFLPATKASPKEMLPVVDKPLIQYAVEEAYASGIRQMIFVTGRTKRPVEDHFDTAYELETELERSGKHELLALARSIAPDDMSCVYVRQPRALGLGHAVLCAQELIGNEPFAVLLADDFMQGSPPVLAQLLGEYQRSGQSVIAVMQVAREQVSSYGIVAGAADHAGVIQIERMVEKPGPELAPSNTAIVGRYVLTPGVLHELRDIAQQALSNPAHTGEIQLTDGIARIAATQGVRALPFAGTRHDCGSKLGMLQATVDQALQHGELKAAFKQWLIAKAASL